jgi:hypothetical protein
VSNWLLPRNKATIGPLCSSSSVKLKIGQAQPVRASQAPPQIQDISQAKLFSHFESAACRSRILIGGACQFVPDFCFAEIFPFLLAYCAPYLFELYRKGQGGCCHLRRFLLDKLQATTRYAAYNAQKKCTASVLTSSSIPSHAAGA